MSSNYDMNVDAELLSSIEEKLKRIGQNLSESTGKMVTALQHSQEFLSGNQFDRAKQTTLRCIEISGKTTNNIRNAIVFVSDLEAAVDKYSRSEYNGGN